ncbi:two-component system sensor histidine kinase DcuS [Brevibacillus laterosporus]|uniref:histidine kinase n=1 Tax=Brevibacillus laterosporus LMG 15441 TaxID=1042163 RepID=A0A075QXU7_BRELA|nr:MULTISPECIES: DcuS/MalK family sensor histidine kinase [Brevibacillus]AIG25177.1 sensor histidine kinase DcuS [Brevibacillus laterosporus LMG 15441]ERM20396.1 sensory histidine kinase [Brevibacillus laterosporus PE36]MCR8961711.1 DcuS/MalK family sensor histidine kinase [Brevibacillus laterosporus]MCR8994426.1 DcuS/MalK family sensor histidine kinase [Brevibacillus laterosporus]MCZ0833866.1 DcuS/MalK family sensor histidine kinase [Brevibacillus halotolerans]
MNKPGKRKLQLSLHTKIILLIGIVVISSLLVTNVLISRDIASQTKDSLSEKVTDIGRIVANSVIVIEGLTGKRDQAEIQTFSNRIKDLTNVSFVVVLDMNLIRKSHPIPSRVGQSFLDREDANASLSGKEYISIAVGVLGEALRVFTPVYDYNGKQIGVVTVGIALDDVGKAVKQSRSVIYLSMILGIVIGIIGALLLARHIKKILFGLEPFAIAKVLEEQNAMLQSVREGVIAVDREGIITLVNSEARRLLQLADSSEEIVGKCASDHMWILEETLRTGKAQLDEHYSINGISLVINCVPVVVDDQVVGVVATFRDKTEIQQLVEQITGIQLYADALRAKSHEFKNKLHVIQGMIHMGYYDQLNEYIKQISIQHQKEIGFIVRRIKSSVFAGFLLGKISDAREDDVELILNEESYLAETEDSELIHSLITIVGNLINNAMEASIQAEVKKVELKIEQTEEQILIELTDSGQGIPPTFRREIFVKGFSTKGENRGLGLYFVTQHVDKWKGEIAIHSVEGKGTSFVIALPYKMKDEYDD